MKCNLCKAILIHKEEFVWVVFKDVCKLLCKWCEPKFDEEHKVTKVHGIYEGDPNAFVIMTEDNPRCPITTRKK